jgi:hypothetical protein
MTASEPRDLLKRIVDAYDRFTAAEIDLKPTEIEPFKRRPRSRSNSSSRSPRPSAGEVRIDPYLVREERRR